MVQGLSVVGKRLVRPDTAAKATGSAIYTTDTRLVGMLIGKVLRCPHPHARIVKIDKSRAEKLPGVVAVITPQDVPGRAFTSGANDLLLDKRDPALEDQHILSDKARFVGDAVAAVAAVDESAAEEALKLIQVEYEVLPAVFDVLEAMKPGAPVIHDSAKNNIARHMPYPFPIGDVEKGFQEADYVIEETFRTSKQKPCPMEPVACIASFDAVGKLTIWSPHQKPFLARTKIAEIFNLPAGMIRWVTPTVGGGFGNGVSFRPEPICIALAKVARRPVKLAYSREEQFVATERRESFVYIGKLGVKKDGTITAIQGKLIADSGAYLGSSPYTTGISLGYFLSMYRCPNLAGEADLVYTNTPVSGAMRGFGNPAAMWALEQLIDMAAEKIGMDPLEFQRKNHRRTGDPTRSPSVPIENCPLDECIDIGAQRIGWKEKRGKRGEGAKKHGIGMAIMQHGSGSYPRLLDHTSVFIKLEEDGSATVTVGATELGQGITGTLGQIAAEELGLKAGDVHIILGDTETGMFDVGCSASRSLYNIGNGVVKAAALTKQRLLERAAKSLEAEVAELAVREGRVYFKKSPEKGISVAQVAKEAVYNYKADAEYISGRYSSEAKWNSPAYEAVFADVEVDIETGEVKVKKMVQVHDIGRAINPMTVEGQLEGAIAQGIGYTLTEDLAVSKKSGVVESDNFTTYKILSALDMPETDIVILEQPIASGPYGAKSVGESGNVAIAPAIGNAIYDAVGVRITDLPVTPEKVLKALQAKAA